MSKVFSINKVSHYQEASVEAVDTLHNDGFFPVVDVGALRNAMRIDGTVTSERLNHATIEAMATVNADLESLKTDEFASLQQAFPLALNGENLAEYRYRRAVYCLAAANVMERYRNVDTTKEGHNKADELLETADDLRRDYHYAVRDLLNAHRLDCELI